MTTDQKTIALLQTLGLSAYEAKAYAALARIGSTTPFALAEEAGIPAPRSTIPSSDLNASTGSLSRRGGPGRSYRSVPAMRSAAGSLPSLPKSTRWPTNLP